MTVQDTLVDVLVIGSGNGALTAALCAYELGVKDVLVIEKSDKYGGTSATSGGGVWIPCNRYARETTLGPAMTFAWQAARHIAATGASTNSSRGAGHQELNCAGGTAA
jgi:succinate dehydrogenase/fumarate reductase flavoprotein subunit